MPSTNGCGRKESEGEDVNSSNRHLVWKRDTWSEERAERGVVQFPHALPYLAYPPAGLGN
jgi:hypothetical protein